MNPDIKASLSSRLPSYMLPQEWIVVEHIPFMTSGKMNRVLSRRFVENITDAVHEDASNTSSPPGQGGIDNPVEDRLRHVWSKVLDININQVGLDTGFVKLGGDSFGVMDLVARRKVEGYSFTVADLLDDSTVRQMAGQVEAASMQTTADTHLDREDFQLLLSRSEFAVCKPLILRPV